MQGRLVLACGWLVVLVVVVVVTGAAGSATDGLAVGYRPAPIGPMVRPGRPGEGVWRAVGKPIAGAPPVLVTTFRPNRSPFAFAYVAWIDHRRTRLALYPGTGQPPSALPRGPSEVPNGQRWRLLATFNGGFKYGSGSGGGGGFSVNRHTYVPLKRGLGTLVAYRDGRVDVIAWHGGTTPGPGIAFARQNLHLLVSAGRPGPDLGSQAMWGWVLGRRGTDLADRYRDRSARQPDLRRR